MTNLAMGATRPTAWSPHSLAHLINADFDTPLSGFCFLGGSNPTDPFVLGQGSKSFPKGIRQRIGYYCLMEIVGKLVHNVRKVSL